MATNSGVPDNTCDRDIIVIDDKAQCPPVIKRRYMRKPDIAKTWW